MYRHLSLPEGKRIRVYRSGDEYFRGAPILVSQKNHRTMDTLLSEATIKTEPQWGAVRSLHTPNTGTVVRDLSALSREGTYVAAGPKGFIAIPGGYENIGIGLPRLRRNMGLHGRATHRLHFNRQESYTVRIYRNGEPDKAFPFKFSTRDFENWDAALHRLSEKVKLTNGPVRRLYHLSGHLVKRPQEVNNYGSYVAAGVRDPFKQAFYGEDPTPIGGASLNGSRSHHYLPKFRKRFSNGSMESVGSGSWGTGSSMGSGSVGKGSLGKGSGEAGKMERLGEKNEDEEEEEKLEEEVDEEGEEGERVGEDGEEGERVGEEREDWERVGEDGEEGERVGEEGERVGEERGDWERVGEEGEEGERVGEEGERVGEDGEEGERVGEEREDWERVGEEGEEGERVGEEEEEGEKVGEESEEEDSFQYDEVEGIWKHVKTGYNEERESNGSVNSAALTEDNGDGSPEIRIDPPDDDEEEVEEEEEEEVEEEEEEEEKEDKDEEEEEEEERENETGFGSEENEDIGETEVDLTALKNAKKTSYMPSQIPEGDESGVDFFYLGDSANTGTEAEPLGDSSPPQSPESPQSPLTYRSGGDPMFYPYTPIIEEEEEGEEEEEVEDKGSLRHGSRLSEYDSGHSSLLSEDDRPDSVFRAKTKVSRPVSRAVEVDYDTDDGGIYRSKSRANYSTNAQEILDSSMTKIDLPVDLIEPSEVQEEVLVN